MLFDLCTTCWNCKLGMVDCSHQVTSKFIVILGSGRDWVPLLPSENPATLKNVPCFRPLSCLLRSFVEVSLGILLNSRCFVPQPQFIALLSIHYSLGKELSTRNASTFLSPLLLEATCVFISGTAVRSPTWSGTSDFMYNMSVNIPALWQISLFNNIFFYRPLINKWELLVSIREV